MEYILYLKNKENICCSGGSKAFMARQRYAKDSSAALSTSSAHGQRESLLTDSVHY